LTQRRPKIFRFVDVGDTVYGESATAGGRREEVVQVIEHEREHYEVREVPYGRVYSWCPERIVFECACGETLVRARPVTVCACGAVHTDVLEPEERPADARSYHPWLEEYEEWRRDAGNLQHEYFDFVKPGSDD
jgi:hypothetical protein